MKIAVVGAGRVGLVVAACFAEIGHEVICAEVDRLKLRQLRDGELPFYEPGLQELVQNNVRSGRLSFTGAMPIWWVEPSDVIFVAINTPRRDSGEPDLRDLDEFITFHLSTIRPPSPKLVVLKSTVPVGTGNRIRGQLQALSPEWHVANSPEFMREITSIYDFLQPSRVVVGVADQWSEDMLRQIYAPLLKDGQQFVVMDSCSAEMTKYAANAMLAMRISFMTEIAEIAEKCGADADLIRRGVCLDARIGTEYIYPEPGFGGPCLVKDLQALIHMAREAGSLALLSRCTLDINEAQRHVPVEKLRGLIGSLEGKTVAIWGLAFKPSTEELRDAPSITIIEDLLREGVRVRVHDPMAMKNAREVFGDRVEYAAGPYEAATGVHGVILVTEWEDYSNPDFACLKRLAPEVAVVDARNAWSEKDAITAGVRYARLGRAPRSEGGS
jgi:UDPglucose 6-dehydrogenase